MILGIGTGPGSVDGHAFARETETEHDGKPRTFGFRTLINSTHLGVK